MKLHSVVFIVLVWVFCNVCSMEHDANIQPGVWLTLLPMHIQTKIIDYIEHEKKLREWVWLVQRMQTYHQGAFDSPLHVYDSRHKRYYKCNRVFDLNEQGTLCINSRLDWWKPVIRGTEDVPLLTRVLKRKPRSSVNNAQRLFYAFAVCFRKDRIIALLQKERYGQNLCTALRLVLVDMDTNEKRSIQLEEPLFESTEIEHGDYVAAGTKLAYKNQGYDHGREHVYDPYEDMTTVYESFYTIPHLLAVSAKKQIAVANHHQIYIFDPDNVDETVHLLHERELAKERVFVPGSTWPKQFDAIDFSRDGSMLGVRYAKSHPHEETKVNIFDMPCRYKNKDMKSYFARIGVCKELGKKQQETT